MSTSSLSPHLACHLVLRGTANLLLIDTAHKNPLLNNTHSLFILCFPAVTNARCYRASLLLSSLADTWLDTILASEFPNLREARIRTFTLYVP